MSSMLPKIPRFYVNELEYLQTNGYQFDWETGFHPVFRTLPVIPQTINDLGSEILENRIQILNIPIPLNNPFVFALGTESFLFRGSAGGGLTDSNSNNITIGDTNVNICMGTAGLDGWSLTTTAEGVDIGFFSFPNNSELKVGSLVFGSYWDAPHSVDLNVKMSFDYSGTKKTMTRGGSTLNNTAWTRNPKWGNLPAWELKRNVVEVGLSKTGRRIWDIGFSFFTESNLLPSTLNTSTGDGLDDILDDYSANTLHNDATDFYSQVITKTLGCGNRPFIFSPDSTSSALDNFAICTFDAKRFSLNQTSPNLYSTKMRIVETW